MITRILGMLLAFVMLLSFSPFALCEDQLDLSAEENVSEELTLDPASILTAEGENESKSHQEDEFKAVEETALPEPEALSFGEFTENITTTGELLDDSENPETASDSQSSASSEFYENSFSEESVLEVAPYTSYVPTCTITSATQNGRTIDLEITVSSYGYYYKEDLMICWYKYDADGNFVKNMTGNYSYTIKSSGSTGSLNYKTYTYTDSVSFNDSGYYRGEVWTNYMTNSSYGYTASKCYTDTYYVPDYNIELNTDDLVLRQKEFRDIVISYVPSATIGDRDFTVQTSDPSIASINGNSWNNLPSSIWGNSFTVYGENPGEAVITVETSRGLGRTIRTSLNVTVTDEVLIPIDNTVFPDASFLSYVSTNIDKDKDGNLCQEEIDAVTAISCDYIEGITSLEGIQLFKNLTSLRCSWCSITELDVSRFPALKYLDCSGNYLSQLDLSANTLLEYLNCGYNNINTLSLNFNSQLTILNCSGLQLKTLSLDSVPKLLDLTCSENQLKTLDLSSCTDLESISCSNNYLTALNLSSCPNLKELFCEGNQLSSLSIAPCSEITKLNCRNNFITYLDLNGCPYLMYASRNPSNLYSESVSYGFIVDIDNDTYADIALWIDSNVQIQPLCFIDVSDSTRYFYTPVYWAVENGITVGYGGPNLFSPDSTCTREQIVTFLWRLMGEPEPSSHRNFADVPVGVWYDKPISWAAENGITTGYADGSNKFGVGDPCTREQAVTFLWRAAGKPSVSSHSVFTDVTSDRYFYDSISWAASNGITVGLNDGTGRFGVGQSCTRAMIVTFLYRYNSMR